MSTETSDADEFSVATATLLKAIDAFLVPLWNEQERGDYRSNIIPSLKFSKSTLSQGNHKLSKVVKTEPTMVNVSVFQAIWGRITLNRQAWFPEWLASNPDFIKFPKDPLLELPRVEKSPKKRKISATNGEATTQDVLSVDATQQIEEACRQRIAKLKEEHEIAIEGLRAEESTKYSDRLEQAVEAVREKIHTEQQAYYLACLEKNTEALREKISAEEKAKHSNHIEGDDDVVREQVRRECESRYQELLSVKMNELEQFKDEFTRQEQAKYQELKDSSRIEHEELCNSSREKYKELCEAKGLEFQLKCQEHDDEHQGRLLEHLNRSRELEENYQERNEVLDAKYREVCEANTSKCDTPFRNARSRSQTEESSIHDTEDFYVKMRELHGLRKKQERDFNELLEKQEREHKQSLEKKERKYAELRDDLELEYQAFRREKKREIDAGQGEIRTQQAKIDRLEYEIAKLKEGQD